MAPQHGPGGRLPAAPAQVLSGRYEWFEHDVLDPAGGGPMMPAHAEPAAEQFEDSQAAAMVEVTAAR